MDVVDRINSLCEEKSIKRAKLERDLVISRGAIPKWKEHAPSAESILKIAKFFGVTMEYLMTGEDADCHDTSAASAPAIDGLTLDTDEIRLIRGYRAATPNIQRYMRDMSRDALKGDMEKSSSSTSNAETA